MSGYTSPRVVFYYLSAFGNTGGIEKFNQCFIGALNDLTINGSVEAEIVSVYDHKPDIRYSGNLSFSGFSKRKGKSVVLLMKRLRKADVLVLGHANLLGVGLLAKILHPKCRVMLIAHGIEVWKKFSFMEKLAIKCCEKILAVSTYTKNQIVLRNNLNANSIKLFPNTLDPFFSVPKQFRRPEYLLQRYGLDASQHIIYTLARLYWSEKKKGYDRIIAAMPEILQKYPNTKYILGGKFDRREKVRVERLIESLNLQEHVILTGYIDEQEKNDHYLLADVFVLPSRKEGFGIVFLEALACGLPVIGGNQDGTVEALKNGSLGTLINPSSHKEIAGSILEVISSRGKTEARKYQEAVLENYHFSTFVNRLKGLLSSN